MPKKFICPECKARTGVDILYGMPTPEAFEASERGDIAIGGCCLEEGAPERRCTACGHEWHIQRRPLTSVATIKSPGGITVRVIEALNGFRQKFGYWPSKLELQAETLAVLAANCLTPLGFYRLQSKVELVIGRDERLLARGDRGESFDYGSEGWQHRGGYDHDAMKWLGLELT